MPLSSALGVGSTFHKGLLFLVKLAWDCRFRLPILITVGFMVLDVRMQLEINIDIDQRNMLRDEDDDDDDDDDEDEDEDDEDMSFMTGSDFEGDETSDELVSLEGGRLETSDFSQQSRDGDR